MVIENVPNERRGFYGSLVQLGYPIGVICSTGIFAAVSRLPEVQFLTWAWRVPFLLSAILVGIRLFIRLRLEETPVFQQVQARQGVAKIPLLEILAKHLRTPRQSGTIGRNDQESDWRIVRPRTRCGQTSQDVYHRLL
jgi:MHS family shikimate/dehydroshikimate transporter-like MFS transporter